MRKATIRDIEGALQRLSELLPGQNFTLERWGQKVRVIRSDYSRPFGATFMTKDEAYERIWYAVDVLRLKEEN